MRFEVPQFIDVEDKIFGPLTFKQFFYLLGGGGLAYVVYRIVPFPLWIPLSGALVIFALLLAFYKINNRPFIEIAQSWISFMLRGKLYIWKRTPPQPTPLEITTQPSQSTSEKDIDITRIKSLSENLDILDSYHQ